MLYKPDNSLEAIELGLDQKDWSLEHQQNHVQVYSKYGVHQSNIIGFKTITEHAVDPDTVYAFLKDVCGAMNEINELYLHGETFDPWPSDKDDNGSVVRTSFKMPFPMSNREFVHGLHAYQKDASTYLIAYTPLDAKDIAVQHQFVRCPMEISGQRIRLLSSGLVQVEHLMIYQLGGSISTSVQDNWFRKAHVSAYVKEWKTLRTALLPPSLSNINPEQLQNIAYDSLRISSSWSPIGNPKYGQLKSGYLSYLPQAVFRLDLTIDTDISQAVRVLADESLNYLPQWNKEFESGIVLEQLEQSDRKTSCMIRVEYQTPFFLKNREYVYYFSREWISPDEALILYYSVNHPSPVPDNCVRAILYPSVHRCLRMSNNKTKIEHLLATDLKGKLGPWQNTFLKGGLMQAQCHDMEQQQRLFESLQA